MIDWLTYSRHVRRLPARAELDGMVAESFKSRSNKDDACRTRRLSGFARSLNETTRTYVVAVLEENQERSMATKANTE